MRWLCTLAAISGIYGAHDARAQSKCNPRDHLLSNIDSVSLNRESALYLYNSVGSSTSKNVDQKIGGTYDLFGGSASNNSNFFSRVNKLTKFSSNASQNDFIFHQALSSAGVQAYIACLNSQPTRIAFSTSPTTSRKFAIQISWNFAQDGTGPTSGKLTMRVGGGKIETLNGQAGTPTAGGDQVISVPILRGSSEGFTVYDRDVTQPTEITAEISLESGQKIPVEALFIPAQLPEMEIFRVPRSIRIKAYSKGSVDNRSECLYPADSDSFFLPETANWSEYLRSPKTDRTTLDITTKTDLAICVSAYANGTPKGPHALSDGTVQVEQITLKLKEPATVATPVI
jgi:hypothetical protein